MVVFALSQWFLLDGHSSHNLLSAPLGFSTENPAAFILTPGHLQHSPDSQCPAFLLFDRRSSSGMLKTSKNMCEKISLNSRRLFRSEEANEWDSGLPACSAVMGSSFVLHSPSCLSPVFQPFPGKQPTDCVPTSLWPYTTNLAHLAPLRRALSGPLCNHWWRKLHPA